MRLAVSETGEGPPVVLLHGLFGRARNLASIARALAPSHRVISLDLRNHGQSPHGAGMDYATLAADVVQTLDALGVARTAVVGHSMGGKTAMMLALQHGARVSRLAVIDIAPRPYAHHNAAVAQAMLGVTLDRPMTRAEAEAMLLPCVPLAATRSFLVQNFLPGPSPAWQIGLREIAACIGDIEAWPDLAPGSGFAGPALFIAGAQSDYVTPAEHGVIRGYFPQAHIAHVADAGHWVHADQPRRLLDLLVPFLA